MQGQIFYEAFEVRTALCLVIVGVDGGGSVARVNAAVRIDAVVLDRSIWTDVRHALELLSLGEPITFVLATSRSSAQRTVVSTRGGIFSGLLAARARIGQLWKVIFPRGGDVLGIPTRVFIVVAGIAIV